MKKNNAGTALSQFPSLGVVSGGTRLTSSACFENGNTTVFAMLLQWWFFESP